MELRNIPFSEAFPAAEPILKLYRVGDFFEAYNDNARLIARELTLTLTGRTIEGTRVPMVGVPHHSVERYVTALIDMGYKVALMG